MTTVCRIYGFFKIRFTRIVLHPNQTQWTSYHWKATTTTHGSTPGDWTSGGQGGDCLPDTDTCTRTTQAAGGLSHTFLLVLYHFSCFQTSTDGLTMACSAIYFLDSKGKVLLCRNYRGDIDNTVIDNFISE